MKSGVENAQEHILSLCTVKTHPYLLMTAVRDVDEYGVTGD